MTERCPPMDETLDRLNDVFRDVFEDDELRVSPETTAQDVEGWDSLMHVTLIINVEKAFRVRFSSSDIAGLKDVGELLALIERKRAASGAMIA
jgi:acyl carrier protein